MKRISTAKRPLFSFRSLICLFLVLTLSSCSWISSRRSLFGDDQKDEPVASVEDKGSLSATVPKAQYDQLLKKYETLMNERQGSKKAMMPVVDNGFEDPSELVDQLNKVSNQPELAETVDVFGRNGLVSQTKKTSIIPSNMASKGKNFSASEIEFQIQQLRKAEVLKSQNRFDESLKIVKKLESSSIKQVQVRAKFIFGELLFAQQEYDLAMQVFEEIIRKDAFSGVVIKALGRLVVCSEKLKLKQKQEQYYSLLNDILGSV